MRDCLCRQGRKKPPALCSCSSGGTGRAKAEFVQLPLKLKTVFDLTRKLKGEMGGLVPTAVLRQAELEATAL